MRAIVITEPGGPESLRAITVAVPEPAAGELRIRVAGAGVNPVDASTRNGVFHALGWVQQHEHTGIGWDVSGTVDALGAGVAGPAIGTRVVALLDTLNVPLGTYAESVVVPAAGVAEVPAGVDLVEAASLPLNVLTAGQALDLLELQPGAEVLVTGAAGGIGGFVLPLAVSRGFRVTGLARVGDAEFVRSTGAELITELPATPTFDGVIDAAELVEAALAVVRDGGQYVGVIPAAVPESIRDIHTSAVKVHHDGGRLGELLELVRKGTLAVRVAGTWPLADAAEAHRLLAKGGARGRYLLVP
ncbi:MAG: NADP-dependent oxidoreductase [Actinomycetota bacterium]|nr:NADP-dependent oxidoreductase [Actinomycetota bacterium]